MASPMLLFPRSLSSRLSLSLSRSLDPSLPLSTQRLSKSFFSLCISTSETSHIAAI